MNRETEAPEVLLAMETSGDVCSVAVFREGRFVAEHTFRHGMHLSERLMGHVDAVLRDGDVTLAHVTAFAVGIGPGSFTGTRIGVMTIKTLAAVLEKPVVGIGSLDALAAEYLGLAEVCVVPILPCRAGVVYTCPLMVSEARPHPISEPAALSLAELAALLVEREPQSVLFCGEAVGRYAAGLQELLSDAPFPVSFGQVRFPRASLVAQLAHDRLQINPAGEDVLSLVPLYISPPPISAPKQEIPQPIENETVS